MQPFQPFCDNKEESYIFINKGDKYVDLTRQQKDLW